VTCADNPYDVVER